MPKAPVLYHGTTREAVGSIARQGITPSQGWGGAGTEGVYLSNTKTGALMWAMSSLLSKKDEGGDPGKFFARGHTTDELALLEVRIPEDRLPDLKADMEQAEDYQYDGDEDDWQASLDQIGDVRFDGPVPAAWVKPLSPAEVEATVDKLGYSRPKVKASQTTKLAEKNGRPRGTFLGDDDGNWQYTDGYPLGQRSGWQASIALSIHNQRKNLSVNGATEFHRGFLKALREIVAQYPEVARYHVQFDGPWRSVSELLSKEAVDLSSVTFLHGTSTALLPAIMRDGLRPRSNSGVEPSYGHASSAPAGDGALVYLTTQDTMARAAARDAARAHGGDPVVLHVSGIDWRFARPDEDSQADTAEESLARLGSIGYARRIPSSSIRPQD